MTTIPRKGVPSASPEGAPLLCSQGDGKKVHSKGLCQACYRRQRRNGQVDPLAPDQRRKPGPPRRTPIPAPSPERPAPAKVDHRKMTPEELEQRRQARKAAKTHCVNDHELTPSNTRVLKSGQKVCKICQRNSFQKYHGREISGDIPVGIPNATKTHCPAGHAYALLGFVKTDGSRGCRVCRRAGWINKVYGLSPKQWDNMVRVYEGRCGICLRDVDGDLHVDHNHITGAVRGLLCISCNNGLGRYEDDPLRLVRAAVYLLDATGAAEDEYIKIANIILYDEEVKS